MPDPYNLAARPAAGFPYLQGGVYGNQAAPAPGGRAANNPNLAAADGGGFMTDEALLSRSLVASRSRRSPRADLGGMATEGRPRGPASWRGWFAGRHLVHYSKHLPTGGRSRSARFHLSTRSVSDPGMVWRPATRRRGVS